MRRYTTLFIPLIIVLTACGSQLTQNQSNNSQLDTNTSDNTVVTTSSTPAPAKLSLDNAIHNISTNDPLYYVVDVPENQSSLVVSFAWGADSAILGNPNIYVRHGNAPTTELYDCRGEWKPGDSEVCILDNPVAGQYHILINPVKTEKAEDDKASDKKFEVNDGILLATTDLFNVSYACENADVDLRAQSLTNKQRAFVCDRLAMTQARFEDAWRKINPAIVTPIENDLNDRVVAELYSSMKNYTTWMKYLQDSSNNSGVFHEESPEDPKSPRAAFRTFNGVHWTNGLTHYWNLEHEFAHYLDARYLKKGNYMTTVKHKISWWSEGLAQYFGFWNGSARLFTTAHSALYPDNILTCKDSLSAYSDSRASDIIDNFTLINESKNPITLLRVNHESGELLSNEHAVTIAPNEQLNTFSNDKWHVGDRFVLQNEDNSCIALAALKSNQTLAFKNERLVTKNNTRSLSEIFGKKANPYTWGHLAFAFFFEEQHTELQKFLALTKEGKYNESDELLSQWAKTYEADFQSWLNWGTKNAFVDSFELPENKLALNSYTTLYGAGDWGFKLSLAQDVDVLTIGSAEGAGKYDLLVGKGKPVHAVAALNADALICKTTETTNRPNQQCVIENAKAGDYFITLDNETAVTVLADTHLYACTGKDCQANLGLPKTPEAEKVSVKKTPRIVNSADLGSCELAQPYDLQHNATDKVENFSVINHSSAPVTLQLINNTTGSKNGDTIHLAAGESWQPSKAIYEQERIAISNSQGQCLGTLTAKSSVRLGYYDRTPIIGQSCQLKESYSRGNKKARNASVRNETDKTLYVFWVFPDQMANKKSNGLLRRNSYAELSPGETWDNITWNHGDRIMLGTTSSHETAECAAIFEVDSNTHFAVQN